MAKTRSMGRIVVERLVRLTGLGYGPTKDEFFVPVDDHPEFKDIKDAERWVAQQLADRAIMDYVDQLGVPESPIKAEFPTTFRIVRVSREFTARTECRVVLEESGAKDE